MIKQHPATEAKLLNSLFQIFRKNIFNWRKYQWITKVSGKTEGEDFAGWGRGGLGNQCLVYRVPPFLASWAFLLAILTLSQTVSPSLSILHLFPAAVLPSHLTPILWESHLEARPGTHRFPDFGSLFRGPNTVVWFLLGDCFWKIPPPNFCMKYFHCFFFYM